MRLNVLSCALAVLLMPAQDPRQDPAKTPAPPALLEVDAIAVDRDGQPVTDLKPGDVEIWLEQYRIPLESMTVLSEDDDRRRRSIVLVLDDITLPVELVPRARDVARRFIEGLGPDDEMAIVTLTGARSTGGRAGLRRALDAYGVRATMPLRPDDLGARVFKMLAGLSRELAEAPGHRRTIVGIGPGWVFDTPVPPSTVARNLRREWTEAVRAMAFANVALYVIDPAGVGSTRAASGTSGLAGETGGFAFLNTNDLAGAADRILREAASYYILRFEDPPLFRTAPLRKLDVRTGRDDVTIRARRLIPGAPAEPRR